MAIIGLARPLLHSFHARFFSQAGNGTDDVTAQQRSGFGFVQKIILMKS
jgi:hypothetical protein